MTGPDVLAAGRGGSVPVVPDVLVREVTLAVLEVQADAAGPQIARLMADDDLGVHRLEDLGLDSLLVAEVIVELEQRLGVLLELGTDSRLVTLADLGRALCPVVSS